MRTLFSLLFTFTFASLAFSQGAYLERGQSGFGVGAAFSSNKDVSGFGGAVGYSASGIFDFGLFVGRLLFEQELAGDELSATSISPFVVVHPVKQDSTTPISVSLSASYDASSYSSDALTKLNLSFNASGWSAGVSVYGNIILSPTTKLQPAAGVSYVSSKSELRDNSGNTLTEDSNATIFGIALSFFFKTGPSTIFRITPTLSFHKDVTTFAVGAGFVFAMPN